MSYTTANDSLEQMTALYALRYPMGQRQSGQKFAQLMIYMLARTPVMYQTEIDRLSAELGLLDPYNQNQVTGLLEDFGVDMEKDSHLQPFFDMAAEFY